MIGIEAGALLRETLQLMAENGWRVVLSLLLLTGLGVFADVGIDLRDQRSADLTISVVSVGLQTWLTIALLKAHGQRNSSRGVGTVCFIGLLSGLGILLGLALFVVPGLILLVRWSMSVPYALAEDVSATDALAASFDETRGAFWPLLGILLVCYAPLGLAIGSSLLLEPARVTVISSVLVNLLINLGLLAGWHAAVAIYLAKRGNSDLAELFT